MTGRAAGYCAGFGMPGYMNPGPGRGYGGWGGFGAWGGFGGRGGGRGRGWRHWYYATGLPGWARAGWGYPYAPGGAYPMAPSPEDELTSLRAEAESIERTLGDIRKRIEELEAARGTQR